MKEETNIFIHVVDDSEDMIEELTDLFNKNEVSNCIYFRDPELFVNQIEPVEICVLDNRFQGSGLTALEITKILMQKNKLTKIIVITMLPHFDSYLQLTTEGIYKYLDKRKDSFRLELVRWVKEAIGIVKIYHATDGYLDVLKKGLSNTENNEDTQ